MSVGLEAAVCCNLREIGHAACCGVSSKDAEQVRTAGMVYSWVDLGIRLGFSFIKSLNGIHPLQAVLQGLQGRWCVKTGLHLGQAWMQMCSNGCKDRTVLRHVQCSGRIRQGCGPWLYQDLLSHWQDPEVD